MSMENSNKRKLLTTDKISALPDVILHHIFSFLDMKQVVQTSLLSSRWRYLWVSLPVINCDNSIWERGNKRAFKDFVDNVLLLRDGSDIRKFKICASHYYDSKRIGVWITSAVRRHLKEMHLQFCPDRRIELPRALFSSAITFLELNLASTHETSIHAKIPDLICSMTTLTTLILISVELPDGNSSGELLFNYPVLENLKLVDCGYDHLKILNISGPQLKTFVIQNNFDTNGTHQMELCAPSLLLLDASYKNHGSSWWLENVRMRKCSFLVNAKFSLDAIELKHLEELLDVIPCVKTIELSCLVLYLRQRDPSDQFPRSPPFSNVRCLKLTVTAASIAPIISVLKMFPLVETLVLHINHCCTDQEGIFALVNHYLKYVEIGWLLGDERDYKCLETLLKNAHVLEKLVIWMRNDLSSSVKETFGKKILSLFRSSSKIAIFLF